MYYFKSRDTPAYAERLQVAGRADVPQALVWSQLIIHLPRPILEHRPAVLGVRGITLISDYFVIASGRSSTQFKALTRRILENVETTRKVHAEGQDLGVWALVDYGDVIVHVFREAERSFYGLERLWGDAGKTEFRDEARLQ